MSARVERWFWLNDIVLYEHAGAFGRPAPIPGPIPDCRIRAGQRATVTTSTRWSGPAPTYTCAPRLHHARMRPRRSSAGRTVHCQPADANVCRFDDRAAQRSVRRVCRHVQRQRCHLGGACGHPPRSTLAEPMNDATKGSGRKLMILVGPTSGMRPRQSITTIRSERSRASSCRA